MARVTKLETRIISDEIKKPWNFPCEIRLVKYELICLFEGRKYRVTYTEQICDNPEGAKLLDTSKSYLAEDMDFQMGEARAQGIANRITEACRLAAKNREFWENSSNK